MRFFGLIFGLLLLGSVYGIQESDALCVQSKDWSLKPCFDTGSPSKIEFVERWSPYYEYKGSELMERKKIEMFQSLENKTFEKWVKSSENNENFNIYYYYISTEDVAKQFKTHGFQVEEITSPHKQQSIYTKPYELKCRNNLQPIILQSETYACVKEESRKKLLELDLIHENYSNITVLEIKDEYDINSAFYITIINEGMVPIQFESSSIQIPIFQTRNQDPYDEKLLHPGEQATQWHLSEKQLDETINLGQNLIQINYKSDIHQKEKSFSYEINLIDPLKP